MNKLVSDEAYGTAREGRHTRNLNRLILSHLRFDQGQRIGRCLNRLDGAIFAVDRGFPIKNTKNFSWVGAHEREPADALPADDGLEEERGALVTDFRVGAKGRLAVRSQVEIHGYRVSFCCERFEFRSGGLDVHQVKLKR